MGVLWLDRCGTMQKSIQMHVTDRDLLSQLSFSKWHHSKHVLSAVAFVISDPFLEELYFQYVLFRREANLLSKKLMPPFNKCFLMSKASNLTSITMSCRHEY